LNEKGENMSKLRSDSTWAPLSPEQRETLETWLFEENLGYDEVRGRVQKEFGIEASKTSLVRFYAHAAEERMQREFLELKETVGDIHGAEINWQELGGAAMALVAKRAVQLAVTSPHKVRELTSLARILVSSEAQSIRRGWLELGRARCEQDIATAWQKHKPGMDETVNETPLEEEERIQKIRRRLFGTNLPD
jgi:hypothetical protein